VSGPRQGKGHLVAIRAFLARTHITSKVRFLFFTYATIIFTLTHWPRLNISLPIHRPDLWAHLCVFGLWTALIIASGFFGDALSTRNITLSALVAAAYAGVDEALQAIPFLHRTCAWDDYGCNSLGVGLVAVAAWLLSKV